ncbi:MAG TPA: type III-B CRISPR module RAMP protein Cmr4 [Methylomusa anaerophila]|uniref:RAMP superfamily protein n=1 Tax=Methylomusa anaerophila TaxID=1930071 RepID=A0A348ALW6_9FIRM|nr:type III-B CRISPR module RAMP protein Cmr4 [Methylomusa anaerophila]BBB92064.1 RAMP superfamily protein [Methylomusa anaerophila]HML87924.1 type III-B CRISPR module RAMP protein Cmr4 [Methylomusa anaerophila]
MYKIAKPLFLLCDTPLHAGSGNDLGIVDLPIQRERHTGFPKVESSGIKGCIRESFEVRQRDGKTFMANGNKVSGDDLKKCIELVFGPEGYNADEHAGALGFTDARVLLFPVKSMQGVFAWITCPKVLQRFQSDLKQCERIELGFTLPGESCASQECQLFIRNNPDVVILEEYSLEIKHKNDENCTALAKWLADHVVPQGEAFDYWRCKMAKDILVVSDDEFRDFVTLSTEVITRIKIDPVKGIVEKGALFTEEYLPSETVLYSLALATPIFAKNKGCFTQADRPEAAVMQFLVDGLEGVLQLGGNATIGKGITQICI